MTSTENRDPGADEHQPDRLAPSDDLVGITLRDALVRGLTIADISVAMPSMPDFSSTISKMVTDIDVFGGINQQLIGSLLNTGVFADLPKIGDFIDTSAILPMAKLSEHLAGLSKSLVLSPGLSALHADIVRSLALTPSQTRVPAKAKPRIKVEQPPLITYAGLFFALYDYLRQVLPENRDHAQLQVHLITLCILATIWLAIEANNS